MSGERVPRPTNPALRIDSEYARWSRTYGREGYYYGEDPGPVARRAVRYHRPYCPEGGTALDAGCGEGQDLAFLAEQGYAATGVEFTPDGARKAEAFLKTRGLPGQVRQEDLRAFKPDGQYDLLIAVNVLQFLGQDCLPVLDRLIGAVRPGGVIGLSLFGRDPHEAQYAGTLCFVTLQEVLERFEGWQPMEAARLWQWNVSTNEPQAFVTLIARNTPPVRPFVAAASLGCRIPE